MSLNWHVPFYHDWRTDSLWEGQSGYSFEMMDYEISAFNAAKLVDEGVALLIDVREPWEYRTAHVEASTLIPMGEFAGRAHQELDPEAHLLILCHHGARSLSVTNWLRQQGFDKAQSVEGGINAWSAEVDSTVPRY